MNKEELLQRIQDAELEIRSAGVALADKITAREITKDDAQKQIAELRSKKAEYEKQLAAMENPIAEKEERAALPNNEDFLKAVKENRSITIAGNGKVNQTTKIFDAIDEKDGILAKATVYTGPNASTNIPVITPSLEDPEAVAEGGTTSNENAGGMDTTEITVGNYITVLPVTAEALQTNSVNIQAVLPELLKKAFAKKMRKGMLTGSGTGKLMKGIFTSGATGATAIAGSYPTIAELAGLAVDVAGYDEEFTIVMNPVVYQHIMADTSTDETTKLYKQSLITSKTIEGVKVSLEKNAPTAVTSGSVVVAAAPLSRYAIGVAGEVVIDPIKVKGDSKTYFQATMFFSGKQVLDSDVKALKVA